MGHGLFIKLEFEIILQRMFGKKVPLKKPQPQIYEEEYSEE